MIRSILFDMGNVLVPFSVDRAYAAMSKNCGLASEEVAARIRDSGLYNAFESGQIDTAAFLAKFTSMLGLQCELPEFREIWNSIFFPHTTVSEELVVQLKEGYRLVLLSNTNELHYGWLREHYPILGHFDAYTLSYEVGAMKPDPKIYAAAVGNAQCKPEECFFTDDIERYVEAARDFGIDAEQFTDEANLRRQLTARGLLA